MSDNHPRETPLPRIAILDIGIESSTFSPHRSDLDDFNQRRGDELLARYPFLAPGSPLREAADWVPLMQASAIPGGAVVPTAYDQMEAEILDLLEARGPFDGVFFHIHGAMSVVGRQDAEGQLATKVRRAAGDQAMISTSMDLHGNVTQELLEAVDLITCYRMAPHEDAVESWERAVQNLVTTLQTGSRPRKAWVRVPVLLPGEKTSTRIEPAKSIYAQVPVTEQRQGVLDAAIWVGYAWADEPRCNATVVVTGEDQAVITAEARRLAELYWDAREDFAFVTPTGTFAECLDQALASDLRPFMISDSGDNPTAGGSGDMTWAVARLLEHPAVTGGEASVLYTAIPDPEGARAAYAAGPGAQLTLTAGARVDHEHQGPVTLEGTVVTATDADPVGGKVAVVGVGGLHVVITERRKPYHLREDFEYAGVNPDEFDIVISKVGYLEPYLYGLAADWRMALTPGGVDQDLLRLGHQHIERPMFPFDPKMPDPDLSPTLLSPRVENDA
ncbi:M81 family metallopeptidase [Nesterenkonia sp. MY13]|uniref:M81 family metallopeptidase n=1 Tax=Nesterenkonia sedimenti TaxID=1463632 RepID=A0A7X8TJ53_9MICC|nr:M81 family metallopeptidase [Nesterenkonia sedimenti]NLS09708.1 M81 family metallopeptidase [Nesterenkonia sedimenti]